MQAVKIDITA